MEGLIIDVKCSLFLNLARAWISCFKNTLAGKWETFYGSLRKL